MYVVFWASSVHRCARLHEVKELLSVARAVLEASTLTRATSAQSVQKYPQHSLKRELWVPSEGLRFLLGQKKSGSEAISSDRSWSQGKESPLLRQRLTFKETFSSACQGSIGAHAGVFGLLGFGAPVEVGSYLPHDIVGSRTC